MMCRLLTKNGASVTISILLAAGLFPGQIEAQESIVINEFLASNDRALADEDGQYSDWIELHNPTGASISLEGWRLTDNSQDLAAWTFPAVSVPSHGYLVVFASGKDRAVAGAPLHTSFRLDAEGEYLALINPAGEIASEFAPMFPEQYPDISYGLAAAAESIPAVPLGAQARFLVPQSGNANLAWTTAGFDDSSWTSGSSIMGYVAAAIATEEPGFIGRLIATDDTGADGTVDSAIEAEQILDGTKQDIGISQDVQSLVSVVNMGDAGTFQGADPYPGGIRVPGGSGEDFVVEVTATVTIPEGDWSIGFGSDDGGALQLAGIDFINEFNVNGGGGSNDTLFYNAPRGHGWTWGTFSASQDSLTTTLRAYFYERAGGDSFEIAIKRGHDSGQPSPQNGWFLLEDHAESWRVNSIIIPPSPPYEAEIETDVHAAMRGVNSSVWVRVPFEVADISAVDRVSLDLRFDSGFVAYLNGVEVARQNAPSPIAWNSASTIFRPREDTNTRVAFDVSSNKDALRQGQNVLAIHALANSVDAGRFFLAPELELIDTLAVSLAYMDEPTPNAANGDGFEKVLARPTFSHDGGSFQSNFALTLTTEEDGAEIRYTLNGAEPTEDSLLYGAPISIQSTTLVRARVFKSSFLPSPAVSRMFLKLGADVTSFSSDLPLVVVDNLGAGGIPSDPHQPSFMTFFEPGTDGRTRLTAAPALETRAGIKVRGSSTAGRPKASYTIEAWIEAGEDKEISPFGLREESDWIFYGPYDFDRALIRNAFIYELSNQIGRYAVRARFIELFVNRDGGTVSQSDYAGVYVFMEKIKRDPNRVDIEPLNPVQNSEPEITGGYMLKIDRPDPGDSGFNAAGQTLRYVEPKEREISPAQASWIQNYMNAFGAALNGPNFADPQLGYEQYIDAGAWIDHHLLNVLAKNVDALRLSTYMHKPRNGKLAMGPIWDFDRSMESYDGRDDNPQAWNGTGDGTDYFNYPWWNRLFQDRNFWQRYVDRWQELRRSEFSEFNIHATIDGMADELREAQVRNFQQWNFSLRAGGWQGEIDHLKQWLSARLEWIDSQFPGVPQFSRPGGLIEPGAEIGIDSVRGTIYYTTDGTDPRLSNGSVSPSAQVFQSDRFDITLVPAGDTWKYLDNGSDQGSSWRGLSFDDSAWSSGPAELGYGDGDETTVVSFGPNSSAKYVTTYFRNEFQVSNAASFIDARVRVVRDDGAVVYLNGQEIARSNMSGGAIAFDTPASGTAAGGDESQFNEFGFEPSLLQNGNNVIAVEIHQANGSSSDISFNLELAGTRSSQEEPLILNGTTLIRARSRDTDLWSAMEQAVFVIGDVPSVAITELMYHPAPDPAGTFNDEEFEFIELMNTGDSTVNLAGLTLQGAVRIVLNYAELAPGEIALVVRNRAAFESRYGTGHHIAGVFDGNLNNATERVALMDAAGRLLHDFTYSDDDPWPAAADGGGSSLEVINLTGNYSDPANWRASAEDGGTPGTATVPAVEILSVGEQDGQIRVRWLSETNGQYTLQRRFSLTDGDWETVSEHIGTGAEMEANDPPDPEQTTRFYRLMKE